MSSTGVGAYTTIIGDPGAKSSVHTVCPKCGRSEVRYGTDALTGMPICTWGGHEPTAMTTTFTKGKRV